MSVIVNFKTDQSTKTQAQHIAKEMGLSLSSILNAYLKTFTREKKIEINVYDIPLHIENKWNREEDEALQNGKDYENVDEMMSDIFQS